MVPGLGHLFRDIKEEIVLISANVQRTTPLRCSTGS